MWPLLPAIGQTKDRRDLPRCYKVVLPDVHLAPDFNIAPSTFQPIIRSSSEDGEREVVLMRWGLIPEKTADPDSFKTFSTTNARAETILEKPIWKGPFQHSRCLVVLDGFYEWVRPESRPDDCPACHTTGPAVPSAVP